jgi:citrate lyase subunit beta / citryl-CoA lyase
VDGERRWELRNARHRIFLKLAVNDIICRTYLFVPATRTDRVATARAAGPDAVILDLEDAVPISDKAAARDAALRDLGDGAGIFVRVNGPDTEWFEDDLKLCAEVGASGVVVPKAEDPEHLRYATQRLPTGIPILLLIETARGFGNLATLCAVTQVRRLIFGSIDFQVDLGITGEGEELLYFRSKLVLASRLAGLQPPVDGVTVNIHDTKLVRDDALRAKRLGFGGKLCIHPKQVAPVNECFRPTADDITWARRIVEAAESARGGAVAVDGKMVDRPVILKAVEILSEAKRLVGS